MNVLFTGVGRRVELLRAFRAAYRSLDLPGAVIGVDIEPLAPAASELDRFYLVPRSSEGAFGDALVDICRAEHVDLVLPLIDPDIPVLAQLAPRLASVGADAVVLSPEAAEITADKLSTAEFFRSLRIPTPAWWGPAEAHEIDRFPVFIKPRRGSAGEHAYVVRNARELAFFLDYVPDPVVAEFLEGPEITTDLVCGPDGDLIAFVSRRRIRVRAGEVSQGVTVYDPEIAETCILIAKALETRGPITIQCMFKDGRPYFTEINARFGGGAPLGIAAGVDYPKLFLARAVGLEIDEPPLGSYATGLHMTRFDDSHFLTEDELAARGRDLRS